MMRTKSTHRTGIERPAILNRVFGFRQKKVPAVKLLMDIYKQKNEKEDDWN